ncbi:tape measure protein [Klebsiella pneumoniae]|uniref:tape measure protein n=1 Tax=Klebsiella pneumoniae TaxID=573 RepID=UPI0018A2992D|nr:tape measure protein [Klebsiella pneumoniae]MBF7793099.1 tape measure protein [Klebsiella pneumoniae]MBF7799219.1 tape measure protein [Klebsiella pneumoniae]HCA6517845.1 tape measure protein [Klebsiella pneumoniae]HCA6854152.1 tape measure protein [Klebsiella pneumoniae]HCA6881036.1 tape measure protein [Klebsiella pneumoniae]
MTDQSADLVTKIDVIPDLDGLNSFDAAIDKAIAKVNQLDAAIKRVNNLKPASPYAPSSASTAPTAAATAAIATVAATGTNLIARTPLAETVRRESQKVARAAVQGMGNGIGLPLLGGGGSGGGGLLLPPPRAGGFNPFDASHFSGEPLNTRKKPVADAVQSGRRNPFGVDTMLAGAGLTVGIMAAGNALADSLDSIQRQQAQIARLTQTTGDAKEAFFALNQAASDVRSDSGAFISTYANMATATQKLGKSQEETIRATQGLVGALQLGGGSAEAVNAALYQMGQAFSSDRFGGDEFRSFMEAIGTMAPEVAKAFGTDVKGLRAMSEAGKLTAETMIKAFEKMAASNADLLKKQGWTWGQTMTVMKNDWQAFLAQATIGGEWQKFTDWAANTLIPLARSVEKEVAAFWSTLADESKSAILIGILGAVGAAFTALAIPVMAAIWPFLAIGAAVWVVYEAFVEWKAWMKGEGGTIFDNLFGSFDEFEKRYPNIVRLLRALSGEINEATSEMNSKNGSGSDENSGGFGNRVKKLMNPFFVLGNAPAGMMNFLDGVLGLFGGAENTTDVTNAPSTAKSGVVINNSNSGNHQTQIVVNSPKEAAETVNNIANPGTISGDMSGNIAESLGVR